VNFRDVMCLWSHHAVEYVYRRVFIRVFIGTKSVNSLVCSDKRELHGVIRS